MLSRNLSCGLSAPLRSSPMRLLFRLRGAGYATMSNNSRKGQTLPADSAPKVVYMASGARILRSFKFTALMFTACGAIALPNLYLLDVPVEGLVGAGLSATLPLYALHALTSTYVVALRVEPSDLSPHRTAAALVGDRKHDAYIYVDKFDGIGRIRTEELRVSALEVSPTTPKVWVNKETKAQYWVPELGGDVGPAMQALADRLQPSVPKKRRSVLPSPSKQ